MSNSIDRTTARSTKGWIAGDHIAASDQKSFLNDTEADIFFQLEKTTKLDISDPFIRPQ